MSASAVLPARLPTAFFLAWLNLLPSGVACYTQAYRAVGAVVNFEFAYLNPAAQPATSCLEHWLGSPEAGIFAFRREAFLVTAPTRHAVLQADGCGVSVRLHACRRTQQYARPGPRAGSAASRAQRLHTHVGSTGVRLYTVKRIMENTEGILRPKVRKSWTPLPS